MYPLSLFVPLVVLNVLILFGLLWNINSASQIYIKIFGSLLGSTLSYVLAQGVIDGSLVMYWTDGDSVLTEPITSMSVHYILLGFMVLETLLFFIFVIGYFKVTVESAIGD